MVTKCKGEERKSRSRGNSKSAIPFWEALTINGMVDLELAQGI